MKKTIRILVPVVLAIAIILCMFWYLFVYDRDFTRDMLLGCARFSESQGNHNIATWFYNQAYSQTGDSDAVAIELAEQYKTSGNYTKAEYTLSNAIADGGGIDVYIALCKTYVEQDKLLDAVNMLNNITNPDVKEQLEALRPAAPTALPEPGFYNQYISVTIQAEKGKVYTTNNGDYPSIANDPYQDPISLADGENTIYSIAVDNNGLVSPVSIFGYTVGGVIEKMEFADDAIEAEVRKLLNVSDETELFTNDLWTIKTFTIPSKAKKYDDLKHLTFLENLTISKGVADQLDFIANLSNLTQLTISDTNVSQEILKSIGSLPVLKELTLKNCGISGIAPLTDATGLLKLDLSNNAIRNIEALKNMQELKDLNLQHNAVSDLTKLASCTALSRLDISNNTITSLAPINVLAGLNWLDASSNSITALGNIDSLASLSYLSLSGNKLSDIKVLSACKSLTELNISSNKLKDIGSLSALDKLMYFDFSHNEVTEIPSFTKDCALVTINGSHNKLSSLAPLGGLKHLNNVHMDYNTEIASVASLVKCPVLIEVNVYATKVTDVTPLTDQSIIVNYNPVQE